MARLRDSQFVLFVKGRRPLCGFQLVYTTICCIKIFPSLETVASVQVLPCVVIGSKSGRTISNTVHDTASSVGSRAYLMQKPKECPSRDNVTGLISLRTGGVIEQLSIGASRQL